MVVLEECIVACINCWTMHQIEYELVIIILLHGMRAFKSKPMYYPL